MIYKDRHNIYIYIIYDKHINHSTTMLAWRSLRASMFSPINNTYQYQYIRQDKIHLII